MDKLLTLTQASKLLGVTLATLRNWDNLQQIQVVRTPGGHRRIPWSEIQSRLERKSNMLNTPEESKAFELAAQSFGYGNLIPGRGILLVNADKTLGFQTQYPTQFWCTKPLASTVRNTLSGFATLRCEIASEGYDVRLEIPIQQGTSMIGIDITRPAIKGPKNYLVTSAHYFMLNGPSIGLVTEERWRTNVKSLSQLTDAISDIEAIAGL